MSDYLNRTLKAMFTPSATRRQFLIQSSIGPVALAQKGRSARPNILMIVADDLGAWMLGCYGNQQFKTPNIDLLARGGTRFANAYACTPADSASRATLLTGRTPMQHGIQDFLTDRPIENPPQGQFARPTTFDREVMLSDVLSAQGYRCGYAGYWHLGLEQSPQHKFDWWYTMLGRGYQNPRMSLNGQAVQETGYASDLITRKVNGFLDEQRGDKPFFLVVGYPNPQAPYDGHPQKYYELYANATFDKIGWDPPASNASRGKEYLREIVPNLRKAAAGLSALDDQIPPLLSKLNERALRDNTLIVLVGDTGNLLGRHGLWGDGLASVPANMYEEVVRVPLIWNWPGKSPVEAFRPEFVSLYDVFPTLCEAAEASIPGANLCGRSFLPLATGRPLPKKHPWRNTVFGRLRTTEMARDSRYKLVLRNEGKEPGELFDLRTDTREKFNQYANPQFITVRERLTAELSRWRKQYSS